MRSRPSVRVVPLQPHCFAFGGFELQMIAAMESARECGASVQPLDFWRREADFDVLHVWGLELQHRDTIKWARVAKKQIVLSALLNPGLRSWLRHLASLVAGPARYRRPMLAALDQITVVSKDQAEYLVRAIRFPSEKVTVIPNVVEDVFFRMAGLSKHSALETGGYILCVGNICRRKNQLALVAACRKLGVPLLLVGNILTGEEGYGNAIKQAIAVGDRMRWVQGLESGSDELAALYRDAAVFALPSYLEQQPISALEGAASGKPLVLGNRPYARQEYFETAALADPRSVDSIARALQKALSQPDTHVIPPSNLEEFRRERVGAAYMSLYQRLSQDVR
jgi:glycosyltransferase involved in cell wall biosynthesis